MAGGNDESEFEAAMRAAGVEPLATKAKAKARGAGDRHRHRPAPTSEHERTPRPTPREPAAPPTPPAPPPPDPNTTRAHDELHSRLETVEAELSRQRAAVQRAEQALARARAESDRVHAALSREREQRRGLEQQIASAPERSSLRELLAERGVDGEQEMREAVLELLVHEPAIVLDGLSGTEELAGRLRSRISLVCHRPECQPRSPGVVIHVPAARCDVCEGSNTQVTWEVLLRAARLAGVTRITIVGGSPQYRAQLQELCRGSDLKLDLVSGRSKPGRRRARSAAECVVIWGSTILDHATSAAYEAHPGQLLHIQHRGISGMLRTLAEQLTKQRAKPLAGRQPG